jgi:hypothetical protein
MATYYINADTGNDTTGDGSSGNPWLTLSKAHTEASTGDTIVCQDSTAHFSWESFNFSKQLTIGGESIGGAIFDASSATTTRYQMFSGASGTIFNKIYWTGLAISDGQDGGFRGVSGEVILTFNNCKFYGNTIINDHSGIFCSTADGKLTPTFNICLLYNNYGNSTAGALYCCVNASNSPVFNNCSIHFNATTPNDFRMFNYYGGTYFTPIYKNTIILNDQSTSIELSLAVGSVPGGEMDYTCYYGSFTQIQTGVGNINQDPLFIDKTENNYHLAPSSPCIDTGALI